MHANINASVVLRVHFCLLHCLLIDDFNDVKTNTRDNPRLFHRLLCGWNFDTQAGRCKPSTLECSFGDGTFFIDKQVAPLCLVLVARELRASQELRWVFSPCFHCLEERNPCLMKLD